MLLTEDAMPSLDKYFLIGWFIAWIVLNWGARINGEEGAFPRGREQFKYVVNAAIVEYFTSWIWNNMPGLS